MSTEVNTFLRPIDVSTYPKERVQQVWEHLLECPHALDDTAREDHTYFLSQLFLPNNQFYELGDMQGFASVIGVQAKQGAVLHLAIWDQEVDIRDVLHAAKFLMNNLFTSFDLHRITIFAPKNNEASKRLAIALGFKYEGILRECHLANGIYHDIFIYGLLFSEFQKVGA